MSRLLLLGAVALLPIALPAATPSKPTSRAVGGDSSATDSSSRASAGAESDGTAIPGLCMLSQTALLANAKVALVAEARLKQLAEQVQTELQIDQASINSDAKALDGQRSAPDFQTRQAALQARANALQQKSLLRQRELQATRQKALNRISTEAQPLVQQAFRAHDCGLLIDRNTVLFGNMSNDITAEVARGLDAKITTMTFEREKLAK